MQESKTLERRRLAKGLKIWLDVIFYLALLAGFIVLVIGPIASLTGHEVYEITVPVGIDVEALLPGGGIGGPTIEDAEGQVRFSPPGFGPKAAFWLLSVLLFGAGIYGLILIRRLLATTVEGHPFHPSNPKRLNQLGWIILATSLFAQVSKFIFGAWAINQVDSNEVILSSSLGPPTEWIFCSLVVLVLASIWKQAVQMAEDQALTV